MGPNILVVGCGFIGKKLLPFLSSKGNVIILDLFNKTSKNDINESVEIVTGDATSFQVVDSVLDKYRPQYILLFANNNVNKDYVYDLVKERKTLNNIATAIAPYLMNKPVKRVCFASSYEVYKPFKVNRTLDVNAKIQPATLSGEAFLSTERFYYKLSKIAGFKFTSLRYFNVYGQRKNLNPKEDPVSFVINQAQKSVPLVVCRPNEKIDIIHVEDAISATNLFFKECLFNNSLNLPIINIGSGTTYSNKQMTNIIYNYFDLSPPTSFIDDQVNRVYCCNVDLLKKMGWSPKWNLETYLDSLS